MIMFIFRITHPKTNERGTLLSRIHFHCLGYHLIGSRQGFWDPQSSLKAVAHGALSTTLKACMVTREKVVKDPDFSKDKIKILLNKSDFDTIPNINQNTQFVKQYQLQEFDFFFSPVAICANPLRTVGLGDTISCSALLFEQFLTNTPKSSSN